MWALGRGKWGLGCGLIARAKGGGAGMWSHCIGQRGSGMWASCMCNGGWDVGTLRGQRGGRDVWVGEFFRLLIIFSVHATLVNILINVIKRIFS